MYTALPLIRRSLYMIVMPLAMATMLSSCASKNPLMDDAPTPSTKTKQVTVSAEKEPPAQKTETKPASDAYLKTAAPSGFNRIVNIFSPYRIDIQQGNFISHEMLSKIQLDMTKEQVKFVLGTPLLVDIFHDGRWDYLFRLKKQDGTIANSRVTIFFHENRVKEIKNDQLPSEAEYLMQISGSKPKTPEKKKEPVPEKSDETKTNSPLKENTP